MYRKGDGTRNGNSVETLVSTGTKITGKLIAEGTVRVDGTFEGELQVGGDLLVGEQGSIQATIRSRNMLVAGEIKGTVVVEDRLEIVPSGRVIGTVQMKRLVMADGAIIEGKCKMLEETRDTAATDAEEERYHEVGV
ncbi:MAG: polymer-forming cytoskeletal protein [Firmicutes bacterium]|nr:polymer-forming cytoskeletal protein [Bacillota bacterium]